MENCLKELVEEQKRCVHMFYLEKKSYKEICATLELSWSRVRSLIQNGRRNLKICMEKNA